MRRRLTIGAVTVVIALVVLTAAPVIIQKFLLYARVVQLYSREPDRRISMPVLNVGKREIADTWQAPRGDSRRHEGQDIFAPRGTPILSATEGYVTNIGWNNLGGNTVSVIGAGGRSYYYAHLDSYAAELAEGDYVTTQTILGYVGSTGNAEGTPPHLHFGIYAPGGPINPLPLLADRIDTKSNRDRENSKRTELRPRVKTPRTTRNRLERQDG